MSYFLEQAKPKLSILLVCPFYETCLGLNALPYPAKENWYKQAVDFLQDDHIICTCISVVYIYIIIWVKANNILLHWSFGLSSFYLFALFLLLYPNKLKTGFTQKTQQLYVIVSPPFGTWGFSQRTLCALVLVVHTMWTRL